LAPKKPVREEFKRKSFGPVSAVIYTTIMRRNGVALALASTRPRSGWQATSARAEIGPTSGIHPPQDEAKVLIFVGQPVEIEINFLLPKAVRGLLFSPEKISDNNAISKENGRCRKAALPIL